VTNDCPIWQGFGLIKTRDTNAHCVTSEFKLWTSKLQTWQGCSYLISALIPLKKIAKFTGDVPLHAYQVKTRQKPAKPLADPCPSLTQSAVV